MSCVLISLPKARISTGDILRTCSGSSARASQPATRNRRGSTHFEVRLSQRAPTGIAGLAIGRAGAELPPRAEGEVFASIIT